MKRYLASVLAVLALSAAAVPLLVTPASATGFQFQKSGCHRYPSSNFESFNVSSGDAALNAYGVAWSVRSIIGHYAGANGVCDNNQLPVISYPAGSMRTIIVFERLLYTGTDLVWIECGKLDRTQGNPNTRVMDVHLDVRPTSGPICTSLTWPVGFNRVTVLTEVRETPLQPVDTVFNAWLV